jgi:hypothetical protein
VALVAEGRDRVASDGTSPPWCALVCADEATSRQMQAVCRGDGGCREVGRCKAKEARDFFVIECANGWGRGTCTSKATGVTFDLHSKGGA